MMQHTIDTSGVQVTFDHKPVDAVRTILKANGFRWNPRGGFWWRRRIAGAADMLGAIDKAMNPNRPDGDCWKCGQPGRFRHRGAASPVLCDKCAAIKPPNGFGMRPYVDAPATGPGGAA